MEDFKAQLISSKKLLAADRRHFVETVLANENQRKKKRDSKAQIFAKPIPPPTKMTSIQQPVAATSEVINLINF